MFPKWCNVGLTNEKLFKLLSNELVLWDEKPTYMNHDIIEMLMDQS